MINAGPRAAFREVVTRRLRALSRSRFEDKPVPIELFVVGDRDAEKTEGLEQILSDLADPASTGDRIVELRNVWANIFRVDGERDTLRSRIRRLIDDLRIPLNQPLGRYVIRPSQGRLVTTMPGGLEIVVLGPAVPPAESVVRDEPTGSREPLRTIEPLGAEAFAKVTIETTPAPLTVAWEGEASRGSCQPSDNASRQAGGAYVIGRCRISRARFCCSSIRGDRFCSPAMPAAT